MNALESFERKLQQDLGAVVIGMEPVIRALAIAVVARGHVLLQGAPGLGKTLLSKSLAGALGGVFKRVQGTADLMPSDITGVHVFDTERRDFVFRPGPVFADVLLVDEINRTGPKTQSALLEAMEERQVTIDRKNYPPAGEIPGHRHAEPARVRRHLSAAGVAARSVHAAHRPQPIRGASTSWRSSRSTATRTRTLLSTSRKPRALRWPRHKLRSRAYMLRRSSALTSSISRRHRASMHTSASGYRRAVCSHCYVLRVSMPACVARSSCRLMTSRQSLRS